MRRLLLAAPFVLLPLLATAQEHDHTDHDSLPAHEHGSAQLNAALDEHTLELELNSPAMNLLGFEHAANSAEDKAVVAEVARALADPVTLFGLQNGNCSVIEQDIDGPMFGGHEEHAEHAHSADDSDHKHEHEHEHEHSDIHAQYSFDCKQPEALGQLDLGGLFKRFPGMHKIQLQMIGPAGQKGAQLDPANATANF